jgi:hypothetical protein
MWLCRAAVNDDASSEYLFARINIYLLCVKEVPHTAAMLQLA